MRPLDSFLQQTPIERWLTILVVTLYFAFPVAIGLANLSTLLFLITAIILLRRKVIRQALIENKMIWLLFLMYGVIIIGLTYSSANWDWKLIHIDKYAKMVYASLLIAILVTFPQLQRFSLQAFIVAMLFIVASTWLNVWFLLPWSATQSIGWGQSHHVFGDHITQNVMMSFFCALTIHYAIKSNNLLRIFWVAVSVAAAVSITHLSTGRTGLVVLIASLFTYACVMTKGKWLPASIFSLIIASVLAISTSSTLQSRFTQAWHEFQNSQSENQTSIGHRLYNYQTTPKLIAESPIIGHGTGSYHEEICRHIEDKSQCSMFSWHPHNQYLFFAAEHGMVGLAVFLMLIGYMYYLGFKNRNHTSGVLLIVLASILAANSLINSPLWSSRENHFFMYMLALLTAMASSHKARSIE